MKVAGSEIREAAVQSGQLGMREQTPAYALDANTAFLNACVHALDRPML